MSDAATIHASGGLLTPGILAEVFEPRGRHEFVPGSFRTLEGEPIDDFEVWLEQGFRFFCDRYDDLADELATLDRSALRDRWALPLLRFLGWEPVFQASHLRPSSIDERTFPISHLGWDDPLAPPLHIEPTLDREQGLDARPAPRRNAPHDDLQQFLNLAPQVWGIVTNGRELRVVRDFHHSTAKGFVAIDLEALFASRSFVDFRGLVRLAHVSRFMPADRDDVQSTLPLESLYDRARAAGVSVGKALHPQVRKAIETLAGAAVRNDPDLRRQLDDATYARDFFGEVLRTVYRLLFLFFAEQRGILPGRDSLYADSYSVTRLRELAERGSTVEGRRSDLYEGLKATFRLMHDGADPLGIKAFGGQLFEAERTPIMTGAEISNRDLLRAITALSTVEVDGLPQHVAYATIGVEELGAVYESLLDYTPRIATEPTPTENGVTVAAGGLYLERVGDRELGAYYTPADLVDFTLEVSLDRLIEERCHQLAGREAEAALLDIRVIDPACGSGAFLVAVIDRLALALCDVRNNGQQPTEAQLARGRRDVLQNCIYGIDLDPFAAELCKVALWIHCAVRDLPLTFLDHRIQHGNSLVGWPLRNIPDEIPIEAYPTKGDNRNADAETKEICASARERNRAELKAQNTLFAPRPDISLDYPPLWTEEEKTPADVEKKADAYAEYVESTAFKLWAAAANLWASSFFWTADAGDDPPTSTDYWAARRMAEQYRDGELLGDDVQPFLDSAQVLGSSEIAELLNFFHWPLRFPEIAERGGFDFVTGNPPWEQFESREEDFFRLRAPGVSALTGAQRKKAIEELVVAGGVVGRDWRRFEHANRRMTDFARESGRFTPSGGKVNTYLLFTETDANNTLATGRAGFIVKSSLGIDVGGQPIFQPLVAAGRVDGFYDVVNGGRGQVVVFQGVAEVERFAVLSLGPTGSSPGLAVSMMNWSVDEARVRKEVSVSSEALAVLNPVTRSLPSFREPEHWELALRLQRLHPTLDFDRPTAEELTSGEREEPTNPWDLKYATLFNSTTDSHHFLKREDLEADGWRLGQDMIFRRDEEEALPLYEGQLVNRYDHRARTYEGYGPPEKKYGRKPGIPYTTDEQKSDPSYEIEPRYWMLRDPAETRIEEKVGSRLMIGIRDVNRPSTDSRCAKAALLPRWPATHVLPVIGIGRNPLEFLAIYNATTFDFLVRGKMPGGHVALTWMLSQLACPEPGLAPELAEEAALLSGTSTSAARLLGCEPLRWDIESRYELDTRLDARVAHTYGLAAREYEVVLDSFDVLARQEINTHGRYRFKDDCMKAYGDLA